MITATLRLPQFLAWTILGVVVAATSLPAAPPANKIYFTILVGLEAPYSWEADCVRFTDTELCRWFGGTGACGTWYRIDSAGSADTFAVEMNFESDGDRLPVTVEARATVDDEGNRHSISGSGFMEVAGTVLNFGFSGRPVSHDGCFRLLGNWDFDHKDPECLGQVSFGDPLDSPYILPYQSGTRALVSQGYCAQFGTHEQTAAYDFEMPVGRPVLAARAGTVRFARGSVPDDPIGPSENAVTIEHADGTQGIYSHLRQDSLQVAVGDQVEQGQVIARSGNSGTGGRPHLHFQVVSSANAEVRDDVVAVDFTNVGGRRDARGGLVRGRKYRALRVD